MKCYHVTYYYNATGTEGPNTQDYGFHYGNSKEEVISKICHKEFPNSESNRQFLKGCLTAKEVD